MRTIFKTLALLLIAHLSFGQRIQLGARGGANWSTMTKFDLIENITPTFRLMPSGVPHFLQNSLLLNSSLSDLNLPIPRKVS